MKVDAPTVFLVDDHEAFRHSTVTMLEAAGLTVRDFDDAERFLAHLSGCAVLPPCACAVAYARTPKINGLELVDEMRRREYAIPVILVTDHADVPLAVEAMRRGAVDVIQKPFDSEVLLEAIRLGAGAHLTRPSNTRLATLTPRELQVAELIVAGKLNKTIATVLGISCKTVELHRANLMAKLGVRTVPDLVKTCLGYAKPGRSLPAASPKPMWQLARRYADCFEQLVSCGEAAMSAQPFKPKAYLKDGCPFSFKFWLFLIESDLSDQVEVIRCNPKDPQFAAISQKLASGLGTKVSFPTVEIEPGRYRSDSDALIERFSARNGVNPDQLPALRFYKETILPQVVELHERKGDV